MNKSIQYRPDIDGLRAIAVLIVVLFHADVGFFSGGYIGVDVFFVISGYLITSIIVKDLEANKFSMLNFWVRRIRRIIPALLTVIIFCLIIGWFLFLPNDYKGVGQQVFAQSFFSSNILFYLQSGYFDSANEVKPLLHTWSLAVEEQFYLLFPITLFLLWKYLKKKHIPILISLAVLISLALSIYGVKNHPSATFYLLPTRAWELLIGSLLVFLPSHAVRSSLFRNIIGMTGLSAIILPSFLYTTDTGFPGLAALPPCIGTALLIWLHQNNASYAQKLLSLKAIVFLGLISYSLYLWHWPAIVFTKYYFYEGASHNALALAVLFSFIAAILSWKFIERPFRNQQTIKLRNKAIYTLLGILIITAAGSFLLHTTKGAPNRLSPNVLHLANAANDKNPKQAECNRPSLEVIKKGRSCQTNKNQEPSFILWGDSHADAIAPLFYELSEKHKTNGYVLTYDGCPPILGVGQDKRNADFYCEDFNKEVFNFIKSSNIKTVILVSAWGNWLNNKKLHVILNNEGNIIQALRKTLEQLDDFNVHLMHSVPTYKFDPPKYLAQKFKKNKIIKDNKYAYAKTYEETKHSVEAALITNKSNNIGFIDPTDLLCQNGTQCQILSNNDILYYNGGHLSTKGALYLSPLFSDIIKDSKNNGYL